MGFKFSNGKSFTTSDGIPYIWQSGDETTSPSYVGIRTSTNALSNGRFGRSVAVGSGRIVVGAFGETNTFSQAGRAYVYDLNGTLIKSITHPTPAAGDSFGWSVAVGSGRIVVGAPLDDVGGVIDVGSAHIYDLNGTFITSLTHLTPGTDDQFGHSVAVGCDRIVVGAGYDDVGALTNAGSAHIYDLNGTLIKSLTHPTAAAEDYFGISVAVGSGRIVVGASDDTVSGIGISTSGSAHIYDLNGDYVGIITHPSGASYDFFGETLSVGSGRIVVGAGYDDVGALSNAGSVHIYDLNGTFITSLTHPTAAAEDLFGYPVAVGSGRIVVGTLFDDIGALSNAGSVHIYDLNGGYVGILTHPSAAAEDYFGISVAVGSGKIVVGAYLDDIDLISNAGSVHIYSTPNVYTLYDGIDLNYS